MQSRDRVGKVYFATDWQSVKIGFTSGALEKRLQALNTGSPEKLYMLGYFTGTMQDEAETHLRFANERFRYNGEWFRPSQNLINFINGMNEEETAWVEWDEDQQKLVKLFRLRGI